MKYKQRETVKHTYIADYAIPLVQSSFFESQDTTNVTSKSILLCMHVSKKYYLYAIMFFDVGSVSFLVLLMIAFSNHRLKTIKAGHKQVKGNS